MDKEEERDLAKRAKAVDLDARNRLIMAHAGLVHAIAASMCKRYSGWDLRDELVNEGYVALLESFGKFDPEKGRFSTFAYMKIESAMLGYLRSKWKRDSDFGNCVSSGQDDEEVTLSQLAVDTLSPEAAAMQQKQKRAIQCAMRELSEEQRRVVALYYFEDCSVEEIAGMIGSPTGTIKSHLSRARQEMKKYLQDWR
jgi:RNA polymerase sigma factor (sigma-70 family)